MSSESNSKKAGKNLKALFSVICVSVIALGVIVYVSTKPAKGVNEPTTVQETTQVQRSVTVEDTTVPTTAAETTAQPKTEPESTSMLQSENNTPYKGVYQYPLGETVVQGYSQELTKNETMGDYRSHTAVDFKGGAGESVVAVNNGVVLDVYNDAMLGMVVEIDHGGKLVAKYCGLDSVSVSKGGSVKSGQEIGKLGAVPFEASLESHLHFETKLDGEYVDPLTVMGKTE